MGLEMKPEAAAGRVHLPAEVTPEVGRGNNLAAQDCHTDKGTQHTRAIKETARYRTIS
jgi:hypothetical protein